MPVIAYFAERPWPLGLLALLIAFAAASLRIANQYERGVVFRLGRFKRTAGPGLYFIWPVIEWQTKLDLRTDEISGVECLVRWKHPQRGFVPPAEFLPIIENTELIAPLTWLVLDQALATCASWHRHGIETTMAVNISARTIGISNRACRIPGTPSTFTHALNTNNPAYTISSSSLVPETFVDTPIVNGLAYPYLNVEPKAYRFKILNGSNDRFWNLQMYCSAADMPRVEAIKAKVLGVEA